MEDTHGVVANHGPATPMGLNPYCNGRYSWSGLMEFYYGIYREQVLILIVMEDTHGDSKYMSNKKNQKMS